MKKFKSKANKMYLKGAPFDEEEFRLTVRKKWVNKKNNVNASKIQRWYRNIRKGQRMKKIQQ